MNLRIAIVGAGFAGLGAAWHLLQRGGCEITVFDRIGIGGGASGMAAGLLHPYPGAQGRRSLFATEGIAATKELIAAAEKTTGRKIVIQEGLIRHVQNEEQRQMFLSHCQKFGDVRPHGKNTFWILSGMTIDCPRYLEGLWQALSDKGALLSINDVKSLGDLQGFDQIILSAGAGSTHFPELRCLGLSTIKGQVLKCHMPEQTPLPEASSIGKGYIALAQERRTCFLGSTYQRGDQTLEPQPELAKEELFPKIASFYPDVHQFEVIDCHAGFRVSRPGHYLPIAAKVKENLWALTALGSRGLLYHAYFGQQLAANLLDLLRN